MTHRHAMPLLLTLLLACSGTDKAADTASPDLADARLADAPADVVLNLDGAGTEVTEILDSTTPDFGDGGPELPPIGCRPGEGCFLDKCAENADCQSGWCVQHLGEGVCSQHCQEECPPGWACRQVAGTEPDVVYICVSAFANLCRPCAAKSDCTSTGGAEDACIDYGPDGNFCGGICAAPGDCPWGFTCVEATTVEGVTTKQCLADAGVCPCTGKSVELALSTPCTVTNEFGTCTGMRVCTEDGLTDCDASVPAPESCNGADDDCDGEVDEPTLFEGKYIELCDDGNACTEDSCAAVDGCVNQLLDSGSCDDGNPCTVADHCDAGDCVGQLVDCDDQNPCTDDWCNPAGGCAHGNSTEKCDDGDPCTLADQCAEGLCVGTEVPCECQSDEDCAPLEDGNLCNGTLLCSKEQLPFLCVVEAGTEVTCPQPEGIHAFCLQPACDPATGACSFVPAHEGFLCNDGDACTINDTCVDGTCSPGSPLNCNDGNPCTDDFCTPEEGCAHGNSPAECSDGNVCTLGDHCGDGACQPGTEPLLCDDGNLCNGPETCDPNVGCVAGAPLVCNDDDECTQNLCDPTQGCLFVEDASACDDGDPCTQDSCLPETGACLHVTKCDSQPCTICTCSEESGEVTYLPVNCDDGNLCTQDSCDPDTGKCVHVAVDCDDENLCTTDSCEPGSGCIHKLNTVPCDDGDLCTLVDSCNLGQCVGSQPMPCNDGNPCTDDSCDSEAGCQFLANSAPCDDGNACTGQDQCAGGWCLGSLVACDDENVCTADSCAAESGCLFAPLPDLTVVPGCDDLCHACVDGVCAPADAGTDPGNRCQPAVEYQEGGDGAFCQQRTKDGLCDGSGDCNDFGDWEPANEGLQCSAEPQCIDDVLYAAGSCAAGQCAGGIGEIGCCGDGVCEDNQHCDLETHACVNNYPPCQGWEYDGYCWYYDSDSTYEYTCTELCQKHGAECVLEGRIKEASNTECTVCRHWFPGLTCSFAQHDEEAKPCTYTTSKCEYASYTPALSTCDGPKFGTNTRRFCSCTF